MVNDKTSNGYKYTNLLYGAEFDECNDRLKILYDSLFLDTADLSEDGVLYEVNLSGTKREHGYLNADGVKVKIVSEDEFYNGEPTRVIYQEEFPIASGAYPIIGANYMRTSPRGSGYILISYDLDEGDSFTAGIKTAKRNYLDNVGTLMSSSGFWAGISTQDYENAQSDEVLTPLDEGLLSGRYPQYRDIVVSGQTYQIPHYEPYKGWIHDQNGNIVAVYDYFQDYYFDEDGNKVFHRTYLNNPFGAGNYTKQYFPLRHTPISGTLKVYDMDVLDASGNATEIAQAGSPVYYLAYSGMLQGSSGTFDSVYKGYDATVPNGRGFQHIEGKPATLLTTTSWDYQRVGSALNNESGVWVEPSSGNFTNMISITNPQSRYIVEYKWKRYSKAKYVSSFDATRYLSLDSTQPLYSIENISGNAFPVEFNFTKNSGYIEEINGELVDERSKILTFDGWKIRPNSRIHRINLIVPIVYTEPAEIAPFTVQYTHDAVGYSNEFAPLYIPIRSYAVNCPFDNAAPSYNAVEDDLTGNSNFCTYNVAGSNKLFKIPYNSWHGKKIIYFSGNSYYFIDMTGKSFIKNNTFFKFGFRPTKNQPIILMELFEDSLGQYIIVKVEKDGRIHVEVDGYNFVGRELLTMDSGDKELIVRYYKDDIYDAVPVVEIFKKDQNFHFDVVDNFRQKVTAQTVSSTYLHLYKSCSVEVDKFQLYYEAF
jgi:hypothetical protein